MNIDIDIELDRLNKIINDKKIPSFENYEPYCCFSNQHVGAKVKYLLYVLELTYNHPEIEIYLKQLLENFSIQELNNFNKDNYTILHKMVYNSSNISLNSFEIIINFGISVNSQSKYGNTPLHIMRIGSLKHKQNIIGLFVKCGADLNILNIGEFSILDRIMRHRLDDDLKNIIMTLLDFGAKTNNTCYRADKNILEFVELCRSNNIKPAIKNEIQI